MRRVFFAASVLLTVLPCAAPARAGPAPARGPDLPMRRSAWLEQAMDSKTCPIVSLRPAVPGAGEGDAVLATVWRADDDDRSELGAWPALFLSWRGRPLALRRSDGDFDIESRSPGERRRIDLSWQAPAEGMTARLRLQPPRRFVEDGQGGWVARPPSPAGQAHDQDQDSTRTLWRGVLSLRSGEGLWTREVEVESICGP